MMATGNLISFEQAQELGCVNVVFDGEDFAELAREWGFHAVVLANGAWRDRPLPVEGADAYVGKGLVYQNPFIIWFNHACEAGYEGPVFEPEDDVMVVGGGIAARP